MQFVIRLRSLIMNRLNSTSVNSAASAGEFSMGLNAPCTRWMKRIRLVMDERRERSEKREEYIKNSFKTLFAYVLRHNYNMKVVHLHMRAHSSPTRAAR